jgi:lipopolysaccharide transport system ATP-binding protein
MSNTFIHLKNLNLHYSSVAYKERSLKKFVANLFKVGRKKFEVSDVHALKNINVSIREGEKIGLLGHNGSGKSSFLKTVAGLYPVSSGEMRVSGNVRALLELSLGFEVEATGRENIFYRGLLLGLKPKEIRQKIDEILEFADLGEFVDYPIKVYSAGMQVRLAFAISTAVAGDILLLDEVLGAGDANFMKKARLRMEGLIANSKILILASHDSESLRSICKRGLVFHHGELKFDGPIDEAIQKYEWISSGSLQRVNEAQTLPQEVGC